MIEEKNVNVLFEMNKIWEKFNQSDKNEHKIFINEMISISKDAFNNLKYEQLIENYKVKEKWENTFIKENKKLNFNIEIDNQNNHYTTFIKLINKLCNENNLIENYKINCKYDIENKKINTFLYYIFDLPFYLENNIYINCFLLMLILNLESEKLKICIEGCFYLSLLENSKKNENEYENNIELLDLFINNLILLFHESNKIALIKKISDFNLLISYRFELKNFVEIFSEFLNLKKLNKNLVNFFKKNNIIDNYSKLNNSTNFYKDCSVDNFNIEKNKINIFSVPFLIKNKIFEKFETDHFQIFNKDNYYLSYFNFIIQPILEHINKKITNSNEIQNLNYIHDCVNEHQQYSLYNERFSSFLFVKENEDSINQFYLINKLKNELIENKNNNNKNDFVFMKDSNITSNSYYSINDKLNLLNNNNSKNENNDNLTKNKEKDKIISNKNEEEKYIPSDEERHIINLNGINLEEQIKIFIRNNIYDNNITELYRLYFKLNFFIPLVNNNVLNFIPIYIKKNENNNNDVNKINEIISNENQNEQENKKSENVYGFGELDYVFKVNNSKVDIVFNNMLIQKLFIVLKNNKLVINNSTKSVLYKNSFNFIEVKKSFPDQIEILINSLLKKVKNFLKIFKIEIENKNNDINILLFFDSLFINIEKYETKIINELNKNINFIKELKRFSFRIIYLSEGISLFNIHKLNKKINSISKDIEQLKDEISTIKKSLNKNPKK